MIARLRAIYIVVMLVLVAPPMVMVQAVLVGFRRPSARTFPVYFHRVVCWVLGVRITCVGAPSKVRPVLIVANHISWLDIPVIGAMAPVSFIAKSEIASWPVIGWLAKLQRTVFVVRERRHKTGAVANDIAARLHRGDAMLLFPEGTSADGDRLLPFRSALVGAAESLLEQDGNDPLVQPVAIAYTHLNGLPMGRQHRPVVAWYGDMDLAPHVKRFLISGPIDVTVAFGDPIAVADNGGRKQVTRAAHASVKALFRASLDGGGDDLRKT